MNLKRGKIDDEEKLENNHLSNDRNRYRRGIYLYSRGQQRGGILDGLDPASFDAEATCTGIENHTLVCNAETTHTCIWTM